MPEPLTAAELQAIEDSHIAVSHPQFCPICAGRHPCDMQIVIADLRAMADAIWRAQSRNAPTELAAQEAFEEADERARRVLGRDHV